jgi:hypothetical protein
VRIWRILMLLGLLTGGLSPAMVAGSDSPSTGTATAATATAARSPAAGRAVAADRTVTLVNRTRETIWPWPGSVSGMTGWTLPAGRSLSITVSDTWNARLWGRTGCQFDGTGHGRCQTGDCGGRYQCRGWGQIPATLAEYDMDSYDHLDFYDVSMVDGSNRGQVTTPPACSPAPADAATGSRSG